MDDPDHNSLSDLAVLGSVFEVTVDSSLEPPFRQSKLPLDCAMSRLSFRCAILREISPRQCCW